MKRRAPRAALSILGLVLPAVAQDTRPGIAVLPFTNGGSYGQDKENFAALERGIPATLIAELTLNPALRLVERAETQRLLDEQNLAESGRVDAATAAKIGSLVGARYIITGTFIDYYGKFRVDARIVDVARTARHSTNCCETWLGTSSSRRSCRRSRPRCRTPGEGRPCRPRRSPPTAGPSSTTTRATPPKRSNSTNARSRRSPTTPRRRRGSGRSDPEPR